LFAALLSLLALTLSSCGKDMNELARLAPGANRQAMGDSLLRSDPEGPIPKPDIPANLSARDVGFHRDRELRGQKILYVTSIHSPGVPEIQTLFKETADLFTLADKPLTSRLALARRLKSSVETGEDILKSLGYYEGKVGSQTITNDKNSNTLINVTFNPGPLYKIGSVKLIASGTEENPDLVIPLPESLTPGAVGLKVGDPARAAAIVDAVNRIPDYLGSVGYPFSAVVATRYFLVPEEKLLDAEARVFPGEFARMGELAIEGDNPVKPGYVENLVTWKKGDPWNRDAIGRFRDALFSKGLFKSMEVSPGKQTAPDGTREVLLRLERAPLRTIGGSLNYDSNFGPGLEVSWEHRSLTGRGDDFLVDIPLWKDLQQLGLKYSLPYFFSPKQNFLASLSLLHEETDSYNLKSASVSGGLERQLSRHLMGKLMLSLETGTLDEFALGTRKYRVLGLPASLEWNWADGFLDPTRGQRLAVSLAPYWGTYHGEFRVFKSRVDGYAYFDLLKNKSLILALRGTVGGIAGATTARLPSSLRFFAGGGGSLRGYRYQSVGPRTAADKPAGGNFLNEVSGELRYRFRESMGLVAFADGGNLYDQLDARDFGRNFLWGGGLGFRYYTSMGPFRVDVATPFTPRSGDSRFQLYISLGQSF
jgi:translocation and assembly module TamA